MIESIFKIVELALDLVVYEDKHKDIDKFRSLKERWYEEFNKPAPLRSDAVLDNVEHELCIFFDSFSARAGAQNAKA